MRIQLFLVAITVVATATPASAALLIHFDPNDTSTLFQDGNVGGGTVPVTGVGDPVRWITDVRSPTPGGGALDTFVDAQQAGTGATLANSPSGTVLGFAGNGNLLGFDDDIGGTIDGVHGAMDTDVATLILVGRASSDGSGIGTFLDMRGGAGNDGAFGLQYNHDTGSLEGLIDTAAVASTPLATNQLFVAKLTWDGPNTTATLDVSVGGSTTTTVDLAASAGPIDHDRFRLGRNATSNADLLTGQIGDVYIYNDIDDHSAVHDQLVLDYVPEPTSAALIMLGGIGLLFGRRH